MSKRLPGCNDSIEPTSPDQIQATTCAKHDPAGVSTVSSRALKQTYLHSLKRQNAKVLNEVLPPTRMLVELPALISLTSTFFLHTYIHTARQAATHAHILIPLTTWTFLYILSTSTYFTYLIRHRPAYDLRYFASGILLSAVHGLVWDRVELLDLILGYLPGWILGSLIIGAQIDGWSQAVVPADPGHPQGSTDGERIEFTDGITNGIVYRPG